MPIRLKPQEGSRALISEQFLSTCKQIRAKHLVKLERQANRLEAELARPGLGKWNQAAIQAELDQCNSAILLLSAREGGRGGWDYELTRYRKLPYVKLMAKEHRRGTQRTVFLIGETPELTTYTATGFTYLGQRTRANRRRAYLNGTYRHGPYLICVDVRSLGTTTLTWHIIPKNSPNEGRRHMHAHANVWGEMTGNPLDVDQRTCWGAFGGPCKAACEAVDIPTLLQLLYQFANTLHLDSMLVQADELIRMNLLRKVSGEDITKH